MKLLLQFALFGIFLLINQSPANAVTITNLADTPHQILAEAPGNQVSTLTIPAGQTIHLTAFPEARLKLVTVSNSAEMVAREEDNFTIWPDGTFGPQMRRKFRSIDPH